MGTEKEILEAVESVCSYLPSQYKDECNNLVETYGEEIIDAINKDISPENLCAYIGACPKQLSVESGPECQICQLVATELEKQLGVNKTEKEILKVVENVCSYLPGSYKDECDSFVDTYGQEIISALNDKISPANLCTSLGVCSQMLRSGPECQVCELVAKQLEAQLGIDKTEKEILEAVESVCSYLPSQYKDECNNLVETYGEEIIDAINKDISPENLCAYIGACPKQLSVESGPECQICQLVATELEKQLGVNKTEKEILKAVENVCSYLPGSYKDECNNL